MCKEKETILKGTRVALAYDKDNKRKFIRKLNNFKF